MVSKKILLFFLLATSVHYGQIGGKYVYQFLNLAQSPRQAALGGKTVTVVDFDVNQAFYNPATINQKMSNRLAVNYGNYYGEVSYGTAAYAYTWDQHVQTFHAGINYINYGTFEGRDELGNTTSDFTGSEAALSLGYAYNIPWTTMYVGTNVKLISSTLESYNSWGVATDLGFLYVDEKNDINYGLSVRNLGFQITPYQDVREKLPLSIDAGISQLLENVPIRWHLTLENLQQWNIAFSNPNRAETTLDGETNEEKVSFFNNALRHVIMGAELFPEKGFNIRLGYNFRRGQELKILDQRSFAGISAGFGLRFGKIKFDYSYSRYTLAASTNLFGLMINLE
ncbi:MAG: penicillin-binding protein [Flavobacterium sp.]|uniref:type IX secretion system protein PorQ n=1 Tax=unclassified Flavobacterium TaxID=196869 RepID=UPI000C442656|nr:MULTISPECIES: type IX secretion system protein PorQ [unclassified Flavobacterium]MBF03829.1 penicillin-binding protein [Flavobacterium sp.]MCO6164371.1 type IX secretion system protein PorQ [Flavobacterium sp. NRK F7]|tara:strand:+ start:1389 stop:2408 length:1020 start_codon:yes stop_codon:yes gene_type:complete